MTPVIRSARGKYGVDSEEMKEISHTEFTETQNDDDYDDDEIDIE